MERLQVLGFFSLFILHAAQSSSNSSQPVYLLLVPRTLRSGVPVSLSVSVLSEAEVLVSAHILHGDQTLSSASTTVGGGSTELLTMPPILKSDSSSKIPYILEVKGHVGTLQYFFNSTELRFDSRSVSSFIQTDKRNYLPRQAVKIRVVSIYPDGKPCLSSVDVTVSDPRGNLLRQWLSMDGVLGVVSTEFQLSENPPLGEWTIGATVDGVSSKTNITVAYYVLPKFEVKLDVPQVVLQNESLSGSVTAEYMYGKPVQGRMSLTFFHHFHGGVDTYNQSGEFEGTEEFSFSLPGWRSRPAVEMDFYEGFMEEPFLTVVVNVTEHLTGLTYNTSAIVSLAQHKYKLSFHGYSKTLKPSLTFTAMLKISTYNDQPLSPEDRRNLVQVSVLQRKQSLWDWKRDEMLEMRPRVSNMSGPQIPEEMPPKEMEFPVPADGVIPLHVLVLNETDTVIIVASFVDGHRILQLYRSYTSPSHTYLQIQEPSSAAEVGSPVHLHIQQNFPTTEIQYIVMSRGQVVSTGQGSGDLTLTPETSWAPLACVLVFCVRPDGEIVNDVLQLPIKPALHNQVSLSWSQAVTQPGGEVTLRVGVAEPGSLVGILVVDKATRGGGSDNDITKTRVMEQMRQFSVSPADAFSDRWTMGDPASVLKVCDFVALTDASLHGMKNPPWPMFPGEDMFMFQNEDPEMQPDPRERLNFPETWMWLDTNVSDSVTKELRVTAPDSITTWVATAFVMSEKLGLGVVQEPAELTVFQEFFLSLNLPAFIIRGEEVVLEIILFNYLLQDLEVMVTVAQSDTFQFVFPDVEGLSMPGIRRLSMRSQSGGAVLIPIKPLVLGEIPVSVKAKSHAASDFVRRTLLVKAEGIEQTFSSSLLLEVSPSQSRVSSHVAFSLPADLVPGSQRAEVTVIGDLLGPSLSGLDSLIQMPYGCGEQNMINLAPSIYVLQYLNATGQADPATTARATGYMLTGYERELTFQRADNSFSAFGDRDSSGSTWLSALVLRCFLQARSFIPIDQHVLQGTATWLVAQQGADGSFLEVGRVIHTELQGGQDSPVSLTAYVLIALLEDDSIKAQMGTQVSSALMFLETRLALGVSSSYSLSLLGYALALSGSASAATAVSQLIGRAQMTDGVPAWSSPDAGLSASWQPRCADIEMSAYLLLTLHRLGRMEEGVGLLKWLSRQRNHRGGFGSTQDTIVALQALSTVAASSGSHHFDLNVQVTSESTAVASFHIHQSNYMLLQSQQVQPQGELLLNVTAEGRGLALFQLTVFYNIRSEKLMRRRREVDVHEAFHLLTDLRDLDATSSHLEVCSSLSEHHGLNATGMAILEVALLSGFTVAPGAIQTDEVIKAVEMQPGKVILYLDSVTTDEMCVWIPMNMEFKVAKVQEATVSLYDYYEPRRRTVRTYMSEKRNSMSSCSFCGDDCSECRADDRPPGSSSSSSSSSFLLLFIPAARLLLFLLNL
ncbi:CD109 antigen isoform X1 [Platichthys flesus]|uniref:CD109 antigen isoform X1 n=1 Tax=Platichthys flesus TaxID=8260 RepID=UPI002DBD3CBF|nr:CD109 antigen isoform X1 [Platichthys flesus]